MAADTKQKPNEAGQPKNYKGFVAGVFSGIAKLSGMYLFFQTLKLRRIPAPSIELTPSFLIRSRSPV